MDTFNKTGWTHHWTARNPYTISKRQQEALYYVLCGHSQKKISSLMGLSQQGLRGHLEGLHDAFQTSTVRELMAKFIPIEVKQAELNNMNAE